MFNTNPFRQHRANVEVLSESKYLIPEEIPANEKTAFHGAAAGAAKAGKTSFTFAGKKYPVTMKKDTASAIADQKEATHATDFFVGHKHAQRAGMKVKVHSKGPDGDNVTISHSDPKKLQKYVDNHLGGGKIKESFIGEAYDKTNKATMHVKDAGVEKEDHPFIRKDVAKTGAKVKFHSGGGISYHGSDHQISKALKQHHPDDHKELGNLNYHKSGKYHKDYGSHGMHVYTNHSAKTKKESVHEEYSKTNKASMTIKHGYDEGDGPDNKKFAKHVNKTTGATVKHHKDGSTMSFHGSDHQIHKALQIHHSDDKKGLGDLNYHKKGKTHSDDHVDGQHTYKTEGTTFRERLMSIFENDRAAHYKGATKPEEYDEKQKSSKGAMDMMKTPKSVEADGMKAAKDTAAAIKKSAPGKKMRKGEQNKGDLNIKPSATPVKDPSAKIITAEEYGMFGKKISNSLLKAISVVEDYTHEFDVDSEKNAHHMVKQAKKAGMKAKIHTMSGPGGGNPVVHIGHKDTKHMHKFIKKHYDDSYSHDDLNIHKM